VLETVKYNVSKLTSF